MNVTSINPTLTELVGQVVNMSEVRTKDQSGFTFS
jgi:hypothetical protein